MTETERRFTPDLVTVHKFPEDQVKEFKKAIFAVGGQILEDRGSSTYNPSETEYYRVVDTAARLSAVLFGNAFLDSVSLQRQFLDPAEDFHPLDVINGDSSRKRTGNFLNTVMHAVPLYLIDEKTPLSPSGTIGLSVLSKLPTKQEVRKSIRKKAKALVSTDPIARRIYDSDSGRFNGQFDFLPQGRDISSLMGATILPFPRK